MAYGIKNEGQMTFVYNLNIIYFIEQSIICTTCLKAIKIKIKFSRQMFIITQKLMIARPFIFNYTICKLFFKLHGSYIFASLR